MVALTLTWALATLASVSIASDVSTWQVSFWSEEMCVGEGEGVTNGPASTSDFVPVCNAIPNPGYTLSILYSVGSVGNDMFELGLHNEADCSDNQGSFEGYSDYEICEHTYYMGYYSIRAVPDVVKRNVSQPVIDKKKKNRGTLLPNGLLLAATVPAAQWIGETYQSCTSLNANSTSISAGYCGLSATLATFFSSVSAWAVTGLYRSRSLAVKKGSRSLVESPENMSIGAIFADIVRDGPVTLPGLVHENYTTTIDALDVEHRDDGDWLRYALNHTNLFTGQEHVTTLSHNPATNKLQTRAAEKQLAEIESYGNDSIAARDSEGYVYAFYSWTDGNTDFIVSDHIQYVDDLAIDAWNYGKAQNKNSVCANIKGTLYSSGGIRIGNSVIDAGEYSLSLGGSYNDNSENCEYLNSN